MTSNEKHIRAGEYVLGTLSADERRQFEAEMATDQEVAAAVRYWEARLVGLTGSVPSVPPPPELWERIEAATGAIVATQSGPASQPGEVVRLRRRASGWRMATIAATAIAAALAAVIIIGPAVDDEVSSGERFVAVVDRGGDLPALLVEVDTGLGTIAVVSVAAAPPPGRSHQLWYIAADADPRSLGLVDAVGASLEISLETLAGFSPEDALFAITEEPEGGSPTGQPTSSPIFTGRLVPSPDRNVSEIR